jgi:hypothetical protein
MALPAVGCSSDSATTSCRYLEGCSEYSFTETYPAAGAQVCYKGLTYVNSWWAGPRQCPVKDDCPEDFQEELWKAYDPSVKHEFAYYEYPAVKASYPALKTCTSTDYEQAAVASLIDALIANGSLAKAAPAGGYTQKDREALYREYMLPCSPNLSAFEPANVTTVKRVMPKQLWDSLSSKAYSGDGGLKYSNATGQLVPWPAETGFKNATYNNFLNAVARYPYFCGEKGYFSSVDEACKHELASLFGHAAQETGGGSIYGSFTWLREYGYVNTPKGKTIFEENCDKTPFDCSNSWARYYGRGPKQLTYFYNYAGFSASYFNGDYNFLLKWPDMVAWDGTMFFTSALWFVMTHQPPKPSIHDVMLGRYSPSNTCNGGADCFGLAYDAATGVKHNFNVTIEIVNGGPECRLIVDPDDPLKTRIIVNNSDKSQKRYAGFMEMLTLLKAEDRRDSDASVTGCDFIANSGGDFKTVTSIFDKSLNPGLQTWLDMTGSACTAQSTGGSAMISVTAKGIVDTCKSK